MNRVLQPRPLVVLGLNVWMGTAAGADELVEIPAQNSTVSTRSSPRAYPPPEVGLHPQPCTLRLGWRLSVPAPPMAVHVIGDGEASEERFSLHPSPFTLNSQPSTLNPQPLIFNPQPSTLNPEP